MSNTAEGPPPSGSQDLKMAKAKFWTAAAKLTGILGLSCVPALVGWIDAHTKAVEAGAQAKNVAGATAQESVTNALAYDEVMERLEKLEELCTPDHDADGIPDIEDADPDVESAVDPSPPPPIVPVAAPIVALPPDIETSSVVFEGATAVMVEIDGDGPDVEDDPPELPARPLEIRKLKRRRPKASKKAVEAMQQRYLKGAW